ncbi:adenylosuccinate synthase [candidate division WOR-3 bacterium]|nr:adenylosuccinate synthase [candidate division WOR-3 bacterium]
MPVTAVVGANWGDEGKGKMTDYFAKKSDIVVRFQGGNNAGHTIINDFGKFALHLLPSGVFYDHVTNVLGPGVALNIKSFAQELEILISNKVPEPKILVSDRAQVVMPYHLLFDACEEERLKEKKFGSTKSGIAPFYSDKYLKTGIEVSQLYDRKNLSDAVKKAVEIKNIVLKNLYGKEPLEAEEIIEEMEKQAKTIRPFLCDTTIYLRDSLEKNKKILLEGQLGTLRDPDHGIYPYSTSSSPLAGFAAVGAGIPPYRIKEVIAVVKAYSTCVGSGPFVTEIFGDEAEELRKRGGDAGEYGATTGRPRRMGWFDCVATRYGCMVQGATQAVLTNLDVLGYLEKIPLCSAYETENGSKIKNFPTTTVLQNCLPVYEYMEGWKKDVSKAGKFTDLPDEAKKYLERIEKEIKVPVSWISVGPRRAELIKRDGARIFS